jgi:hypothetical protein
VLLKHRTRQSWTLSARDAQSYLAADGARELQRIGRRAKAIPVVGDSRRRH